MILKLAGKPSGRAWLVLALVWGLGSPLEAGVGGKKFGPFEVIPFLSVGSRYHTNALVTPNQADPNEVVDPVTGATRGEVNRSFGCGNDQCVEEGLIVDLNGGFDIKLRPLAAARQIEKSLEAKGFYLDAYFKPNLTIFPSAFNNRVLLRIPSGDENARARLIASGLDLDDQPDLIKLTTQTGAKARQQIGHGLALSAGVTLAQPELGGINEVIDDLRYTAGAKWVFTERSGIEVNAWYRDFREPPTRLVDISRPDLGLLELDNPLGTFREKQALAQSYWFVNPTLTLVGEVDVTARDFTKKPFNLELFSEAERQLNPFVVDNPNPDPARNPDPADPDDRFRTPNDLDASGQFDLRKDYRDISLRGRAHKRLSRNLEGEIFAGYVKRKVEQRQFGAETYSGPTGGGWISSLVSPRTKLQFSVDYLLTDTIRELSFLDINTFVSDELGAFTAVDSSFSSAWSQRYLLDSVHTLGRGDQLLFGLAFQSDSLEDPQSSQNLFVSVIDELSGSRRTILRTSLPNNFANPEDAADFVCPAGAAFCAANQANKMQTIFSVTGGYRYRLNSWLGLQVRATYFKRTEELQGVNNRLLLEGPDGLLRRGPEVGVQSVDTDYFSIGGGVVLNLRVF